MNCYKHKEKGGKYCLLDFAPIKQDDNSWCDGVIYSCIKTGKIRVRKTTNFIDKFEEIENA